jgi:ElaB/YqjD/DUF883 family membrane-anchored ribosome-binding protein
MDKARNVARSAGDSARSIGRTAFQTSNLIPAALIGVGVYWLRRNWSGGGNGYDYDDEEYSREPGEYRYMGARGAGYETGSTYGSGYGYESADARVASQGYYGEAGEPYATGEMPLGSEGSLGGSMDREREGAAGMKERAGELASHTGERVRQSAEQLRERAGEFASQTGERVRQTTEQVRERAGRMVERTGSQLRELQSSAGRRSRQLRDQGSRMLSDHPLEAAGVLFAVGVLAGLLIPSTRREDELMGEARDDVLERAKETGRETVEKLQHVGRETMETAASGMEREGLAGRGTMEKVQDKAAQAGSEIKSTAGRAQEQGKSALGEQTKSGGGAKGFDPSKTSAQSWDPTRQTGSQPIQENKTTGSIQGGAGGSQGGKDKVVKDIKVEHDIKIKKKE